VTNVLSATISLRSLRIWSEILRSASPGRPRPLWTSSSRSRQLDAAGDLARSRMAPRSRSSPASSPRQGGRGFFPDSRFQAFLPRSRVGRRGFSQGLYRPFDRREFEKSLILTTLSDRNPGHDWTPLDWTLLPRSCPIVTAVWPGKPGQDRTVSAVSVRSWPPFPPVPDTATCPLVENHPLIEKPRSPRPGANTRHVASLQNVRSDGRSCGDCSSSGRRGPWRATRRRHRPLVDTDLLLCGDEHLGSRRSPRCASLPTAGGLSSAARTSPASRPTSNPCCADHTTLAGAASWRSAAAPPGAPQARRIRGLTTGADEFHYAEQLMRQQFRFASEGQSRSSRLLAERWPECKHRLCRFGCFAGVSCPVVSGHKRSSRP
jgi:hypothetical protein